MLRSMMKQVEELKQKVLDRDEKGRDVERKKKELEHLEEMKQRMERWKQQLEYNMMVRESHAKNLCTTRLTRLTNYASS